MGALEDLTSAIAALSSKVDAMTAEISELRAKVAPAREVYTLRDLAELPGSPSLKTLRNRPELQPNGGQPDGYRGAARCWYASSVQAWRRELAPTPGAPGPALRRAG